MDYVAAAAEIAREAGAVLERRLQRELSIHYKAAFDLVTDADQASEKLIVERLRSRFPAHSIVAEEGGGIENASDYVWYVDPLDGTTNYAHGYPAFCVSLGLYRKGEALAGAVYDPLRKELFTAEKGSGAYLNHHRIRTSQTAQFEESLFATGFASPRRHSGVNVHFFHQVSMLSHGIRRSGSAALDLCFVACGRLDGFWEFGLKAWDVAAGLLVLTEAGGTYSDMKGAPYQPGGAHLAASNGLVHQSLLGLFDDVFEERYHVPIPPLG